MNQKKKLVIINNERIFLQNDNYYCENIDIKTTIEGLGNNFDVLMLARKTNEKKFNQINLGKINLASNIFGFLNGIFKTFKEKNTKYLLISITPYTFFASLFLLLFNKKVFIYLRSNGYEEYRVILGFWAPAIYHLMYFLATLRSTVIVCQKKLSKNKESHLVSPSQIDNRWLENRKKPNLDKPKLLYAGRIKIEKGIFSLLKIFKKLDSNIELSIVGHTNNLKDNDKRINYIGYVNEVNRLINIYDNHNIFILPSFTEAHPQVLYESLARLRPVIIFKEINHVIKNQEGIFISKRDEQSLADTIKFIMNNYKDIQQSLEKNKLPTKKEFILQMSKILD
tara:strand:+ start:506 stop:1522 length:1017 start_codon:yes stop_codon:yes gene_type:complete